MAEADITYSPGGDLIIFSACTKKGEEWMGAPEHSVPIPQAKEYREAAEADGLIVKPFP